MFGSTTGLPKTFLRWAHNMPVYEKFVCSINLKVLSLQNASHLACPSISCNLCIAAHEVEKKLQPKEAYGNDCGGIPNSEIEQWKTTSSLEKESS
jgi:hypothetical protein